MYFTRKKNTLHATLFHLDDMTVDQKHEHLTEVYKLGIDSFNTILQPKSAKPIHFIIPQICSPHHSDELMFTTNRSHIFSDVFGMIDDNNGTLFPKTVMENLFSEEVKSVISDYVSTTGLTGKSIFRRPKQTILAKTGDNRDRTLALQNSICARGIRPIDGSSRSIRSNWEKHMIKYATSTNYVGNKSPEIDKSDERNIVDRLSNKYSTHTKKVSIIPNNKYPNTLLAVDYTLSLSELGELVVLLLKMFKRDQCRWGLREQGEMESYSSSFLNLISSLLQHSSNELAFITKLCERLGITDTISKNNLYKYVQRRSQSVYEDHIRQANSFQLAKEKGIIDSETTINLSNTFVSISFFIYLSLNKNLLNRPEQIVSYSHNMTRVNNLNGRLGSYTNNCPIDNYKHDSYITTINTTILPTHLTSFVLKSKMSNMEKMQQYMEVPNTEFLTTQYNNTYIKLEKDFIFYEDNKVTGITNLLSSWVNIRFDKNIQVSYFPDFPSQYPLSLYSYRVSFNRTFERYFKEMLFEYLGMEIDYSKPISTYTKTIDEIFTSLTVLNTETETLISKEFKDYLYTWLITLYLQNNILFKYKASAGVRKHALMFTSSMDFAEEIRGQYRVEFLNNHWDYYRNCANITSIYPMLLEVVYTMLQKSTPEELLENLKTNILPSVEQESKALISSVSKLFKVDEYVISWAVRKIEDRNDIRANENTGRSPFRSLERTLYNQFTVNVKSIALRSLTNNDYDFLLKHILVGIKSYHYFTSLRLCFNGFLSGNEPHCYISSNFKTLLHSTKEDYNSNEVYELNQIMTQYIKKYPKTIIAQPSNLTIDKLLDWYKDIHLTFDIETF